MVEARDHSSAPDTEETANSKTEEERMVFKPKMTKSIHILKIGGSRLVSTDDLDALAERVQAIRRQGQQVIVVHGGGVEITRLQEQLDVKEDWVDGLRVTSEKALQATIMVLCGTIRTRIVERFNARGIRCLGLSGLDMSLLEAEFAQDRRLGRVGGPPRVRADLLHGLLSQADVLVLSPVSMGPDGRALNVNADDAAHAVALAMKAASLDFISDVQGVCGETQRVVHELDPRAITRLLKGTAIGGGMVPKLRAAAAAVCGGVARVRIGSLVSLRRGQGTTIRMQRAVS